MTITFPKEGRKQTEDYGCLKDACRGDTFLIHDNDGEDWCVLVDEERRFIVLSSTEKNYFPGSVYKTFEELTEDFEDYRSVVTEVDLELKASE